MATAPLVREKEGWFGVVATALGCAVFLAWWFWPGENGDPLQVTPTNCLRAALAARTPENSGALDAELTVLALQASALADEWLLKMATDSIEDSALRALVTRFPHQDDAAPELSEVDPLDQMLEDNNLDAAVASASALDGDALLRATLKIATFLTQGGRIDQARSLIDQYPTPLPEDAVDLQLELAELYGQWGDFEGAESAVRLAGAAATTTAEQLAVAIRSYSLNLFDEGLKMMEQSEQSAAGDPELIHDVIETYLQVGETEKARTLSEHSLASETNDGSVVLALQLSLAGWEDGAFAEALGQWRALHSAAAKTRATTIIREYFRAQLAAAEAPRLIRTPVASGSPIHESQLAAVQSAVDRGQPELAAEAINTWTAATDRSRGYVILARLLLWRHARTVEEF